MTNAIIIGGAGPAGSACAIRLAQYGHEVILLDKCAFPRRKLCGGFLGPDALACLHALGVLEPIRAHAHGPIEKIRVYNAGGEPLTVETRWLRSDFPYALAIPRRTLDAILVRHAQQLNVQVLEQREVMACRSLADTPAPGAPVFRIEMKVRDGNPGKEESILTRCFVNASGRNSRLAQLASMDKKSTGNHSAIKVGLQCHVNVAHPTSTPDLHMFLFPGGYGGFQPISGEQANVCMWVGTDIAKARQQGFEALMEATLCQNPAARLLLDRAEPNESVATVSSIAARQTQSLPQAAFLQVGDALNTVEPFSGFGMAHALKTGRLAADCIHEGLRSGSSYAEIRKRYAWAYRRRFGFHLRSMQGLHTLLESNFVQARLWSWIPPFLPLLASLYR